MASSGASALDVSDFRTHQVVFVVLGSASVLTILYQIMSSAWLGTPLKWIQKWMRPMNLLCAISYTTFQLDAYGTLGILSPDAVFLIQAAYQSFLLGNTNMWVYTMIGSLEKCSHLSFPGCCSAGKLYTSLAIAYAVGSIFSKSYVIFVQNQRWVMLVQTVFTGIIIGIIQFSIIYAYRIFRKTLFSELNERNVNSEYRADLSKRMRRSVTAAIAIASLYQLVFVVP
eukprot:991887_1